MPDAVRADPDRWMPCLEPSVDDDDDEGDFSQNSDDEDKAAEREGDRNADDDVDPTSPPRASELPARGWSLVGLETGCGVGNAVFPLLRAHPGLYMYACDFAPQAVALLRRRREYRAASRVQQRCHAFVADVTDAEALARGVGAWRDAGPRASSAERTVDFATVLFVLGAIPTPAARAAAMCSIAALLRPGGLVFYRDHGESDLSQLRFAQQGRAIRRDGEDAEGRLYARNDGTLAHFCTLEEVRDYAAGAGLDVLECEYRTSSVVNAKLGLNMRRVLVHAKMRKPAEGGGEDSTLASRM
jgi:methyltransferase-like protein 6